MARNSAHPMLRPCDFQPSRSFHESQVWSKTTPIPQSVEASTQNSIVEGGGGGARDEPQNVCDRQVRHHAMSLRTLSFGVRLMNGDGQRPKEDTKRVKAGNRERPSGTAREQ